MICNEILKLLSILNMKLLAKLYNKCLDSGTYPWNNSIISPLQKKGCQSDPDNYRAVAVSITVGKHFSTILLERILQFKSKECPDSPVILCFLVGNRLKQSNSFTRVSVLVHIITKKFRFFFSVGEGWFWATPFFDWSGNRQKFKTLYLMTFDLLYMYIGVFDTGNRFPGFIFTIAAYFLC